MTQGSPTNWLVTWVPFDLLSLNSARSKPALPVRFKGCCPMGCPGTHRLAPSYLPPSEFAQVVQDSHVSEHPPTKTVHQLWSTDIS